MQIKTLDGQIQNWSLTGHFAHANMSNRSDLHLRAREIIKVCYPTVQILEEVPIPIKKSESYFLDFYIPILKTAIEVHGEQHYKYVQFYHQNQLNFLRSQKRDREKKEWCYINNIKMVELPFSESEQEWTNRITL
jgi:hypothetical protein